MRYKEISLKQRGPRSGLSETSRKRVADFFDEFDGRVCFEEEDKNEVRIFVNSLDFEKLETKATELRSAEKDGDASSLIDDFVDALGKVGSYGLNNGKRVYAGFNRERKVKNRKEKSKKRTGAVAPGEKAKALENELPTEYENKIICADSLKVLRKLPDNCIDLMITSPPYNFGLDYGSDEDDKRWEEYFAQLFRILDETIRVLKSGGRMIINVQPLFSDYIPTHHIVSKHLLDAGMLWKGEIIWEKNNYNCKYTAWGSWKSPSSPYLKYTWEFIEVFCKEDLRHPGKSEDIDVSAEEFKKWVVAKWAVAPERKMEEYGHPAMFPEKLVERCLKLFSFRNDVVLDVFNGAGTTTAVARKLSRRYLGIDVSRKYCAVAEKRMQDELPGVSGQSRC